MHARYHEVLKSIADRINTAKGLSHPNDFREAVRLMYTIVYEPIDHPPHQQVHDIMVKLGAPKASARDVMVIYRAVRLVAEG